MLPFDTTSPDSQIAIEYKNSFLTPPSRGLLFCLLVPFSSFRESYPLSIYIHFFNRYSTN